MVDSVVQVWKQKLAFKLRRGSLENDLLLGTYFETVDWDDAGNRVQFGDFLDESDQDLMEWFQGIANPPERWQQLVTDIIHTYQQANR